MPNTEWWKHEMDKLHQTMTAAMEQMDLAWHPEGSTLAAKARYAQEHYATARVFMGEMHKRIQQLRKV